MGLSASGLIFLHFCLAGILPPSLILGVLFGTITIVRESSSSENRTVDLLWKLLSLEEEEGTVFWGSSS